VFSLKKCFNLISCIAQSNLDFFVSVLYLELFVNFFIFLLQMKKEKREGVSKRSCHDLKVVLLQYLHSK
jgi:hypothetical protein